MNDRAAMRLGFLETGENFTDPDVGLLHAATSGLDKVAGVADMREALQKGLEEHRAKEAARAAEKEAKTEAARKYVEESRARAAADPHANKKGWALIAVVALVIGGVIYSTNTPKAQCERLIRDMAAEMNASPGSQADIDRACADAR